MSDTDQTPVFEIGASFSGVAMRSTAYTLIAKVLRYGFIFIVQIVLLNLLDPADFGLLRYLTLVLGCTALINEIGLSVSLVQKPLVSDQEVAAAFTINSIFGVILYGAVFLLAPVIAGFFHAPLLVDLLRVGGCAIPAASIAAVPMAMLRREFKFGKIAIVEVVSATIGSTASLVLAFKGFGVWALAWGTLGYYLCTMVIYLALFKRPASGYTQWALARPLLFFGSAVALQRVLEFAGANVDYLLIGKILGDSALGIYGVAYDIISLPQLTIGTIAGNIALSLFSRFQNDHERLSQAFLRMNGIAMIISVPFCVIIAVFPSEILSFINIYKPDGKWIAAAQPLRYLAIVGLLNAFSNFSGILWTAQGKIMQRTLWAALMAASAVIAVACGVKSGINGVCYALIVRSVIIFPVLVILMQHVSGISVKKILTNIYPPVICGTIMVVWCIAVGQLFRGNGIGRSVAVLLGGGLGGLGVYYLLLDHLFKPSAQQIYFLIHSWFPKKKSEYGKT